MRQAVSISKGGLLALVVENADQLLAGVEQSGTNSAVAAVRILDLALLCVNRAEVEQFSGQGAYGPRPG